MVVLNRKLDAHDGLMLLFLMFFMYLPKDKEYCRLVVCVVYHSVFGLLRSVLRCLRLCLCFRASTAEEVFGMILPGRSRS